MLATPLPSSCLKALSIHAPIIDSAFLLRTYILLDGELLDSMGIQWLPTVGEFVSPSPLETQCLPWCLVGCLEKLQDACKSADVAAEFDHIPVVVVEYVLVS